MKITEVHILIVDDNEPIRKSIGRELRSMGFVGTQLWYAVDGEDALGVLSQLDRLPDCIISDCNMPKLNGFEFVKRIKSDTHLQTIPVILFTANSDFIQETGLRAGAHAVFNKFDSQKMYAYINGLLNIE